MITFIIAFAIVSCILAIKHDCFTLWAGGILLVFCMWMAWKPRTNPNAAADRERYGRTLVHDGAHMSADDFFTKHYIGNGD